ncbi:hypothetical protein DFA_11461 [Cavenderia fasciculata]|uniref:Uncharacterized protein n=1 Tax=Cavenderia fasciculata TaxID=261658 RepID=F4QD19_CACFS|nr:uncharacterized protein DFA_11461 [Cavenderia fasciculata]EGG13700.1 hypothetical protein DFA_11461 [Cavenderia fasciculata]|eukprot:XP_004350404.1 hypothetical protein DFA_11461 [Cavenderia fasciculata]
MTSHETRVKGMLISHHHSSISIMVDYWHSLAHTQTTLIPKERDRVNFTISKKQKFYCVCRKTCPFLVGSLIENQVHLTHTSYKPSHRHTLCSVRDAPQHPIPLTRPIYDKTIYPKQTHQSTSNPAKGKICHNFTRTSPRHTADLVVNSTKEVVVVVITFTYSSTSFIFCCYYINNNNNNIEMQQYRSLQQHQRLVIAFLHSFIFIHSIDRWMD